MPVTERRRVRQRAKGPIDPVFGERLRTLREARGLTQADLAAGDFSKGFISLLETGRTRASLRAAGIIAARLGVSVADLLMAGAPASAKTAEITLLRAEAAFGGGDAQAAVSLLDHLPKTTAPALRTRAQRLRGRALVALGRAAEGVKALEAARRKAQSLAQSELTIRMLYDLAQAHEALDEPGAAVALALECDAQLASGALVDRTLELEVRSSLAIGFARLGDTRSAQLQAERALELSDDVTDRRALAGLYTTLAQTREQEGDHEAALTYAHRAASAMESLGQAAATVAALNNVAWVHVQRGEHVRADQVLDRAHALAERDGIGSVQAALLATRAEARLAQRRPQDALRLAQEATARADANPQTAALATLIEAQSRAALEHPVSEVRRAFGRAVTALRARSPRLEARAHRAYAQFLAGRGKQAEAYAEAERAIALLE